jgi:predicted nucleic acid-binding protein
VPEGIGFCQLVIAVTGPVNYLILIGHIGLLPLLFQRVILPAAVREELHDAGAPAAVRAWIASPPPWLEIVQSGPGLGLATLDEGEAAVIALAESLHADLLLIDERKGVNIARRKGLRVTGTLGLLEMAAQERLIDFADAVERLRRTTFRSPEELLAAMLKKHESKGGDLLPA